MSAIEKPAQVGSSPSAKRRKPPVVVVPPQEPFHLPDAEEWQERTKALSALFDEWLADESGYDETTWPVLKKGLNDNRIAVGARKLFDD